MVNITVQDIKDMLKMRVDFDFDENKSREYACLDILNKLLDISGPPNVPHVYLALREAYDKGVEHRKAVEKDSHETD